MDEPQDARPQISISIVVYNSSLALLRRTLLSLAEAAAPLDRVVTVTVVDNASGGIYTEDLTRLVQEIPCDNFQLSLLRSNQNLGYGGGHNLVLEECGAYHLVLNPDVELTQDALQRGIARLEADEETVLLSPYAAAPDGNQEYLCKRHPSVLVLLLRAFAPGLGWRLCPGQMAAYQMSDVCGPDQELDVPLASGCFMLMRGDALRAVGGFDDGYFMYFEDFDLSLRLAAYGRVLYLPAVRIVHHGGYAGRKGLKHVWLFMTAGVRFFRQHGWRWF
jgi:GT2 family glycosyltransferase